MPLTPGITLTATLQDISGNDDNASSLVVALAGFGANLPRIVGTSMLAKVGPLSIPLANGIETALLLWGNDAILPAGTYYAISVVDDQGNVVQCGAYQFNGIQAIDLSVAPPYTGPALTPPGLADAIVPTGTGTAFSLPSAPVPPLSLELYENGILLKPGVDYTLSGAALSLTVALGAGGALVAYYRMGAALLPTVFADGTVPGGAGTARAWPTSPSPPLSLKLFMNGVMLTQGPDYTLVAQNITLTFVPDPVNDRFLAWYRN